MTWLLGTRLGRWLAGAGALVAVVLGAWFAGKREARQGAKQEGLEDASKRIEAGRDRVRDNRDDDPADRLRRNDGQW